MAIPFNKLEDVYKALNDKSLNRGSKKQYDDFYLENKDFIALATGGKLLDDELNRVMVFKGKSNISKKHIKGIAEDFFPLSVGMISLEAQNDGTVVHCDGHHRKYANVKAAESLNGGEFDGPVFIRIVKNGLGGRMNSTLNNQKPHPNRVKMYSNNYEFGVVMNSVLGQVSGFDIPGPFSQQIANALYAHGNDMANLTFYETFSLKGKVKEALSKARKSKVFTALTDEKKSEIVAAVQTSFYVIDELQKYWIENGQYNKDLKELKTLAPFFGLLVHDCLHSKRIISKDIKTLAEKIKKQGSAFVRAIKQLFQFYDETHGELLNMLGIHVDNLSNITTAKKKSECVKIYNDISRKTLVELRG